MRTFFYTKILSVDTLNDVCPRRKFGYKWLGNLNAVQFDYLKIQSRPISTQ